MCVVWEPVRPVFEHVGGGQGPLGLPPAPMSGRAALVSDSSWRLLPLCLSGAPTFCGPGLFAHCGLRWPPASPCSHDRHRVAFTAHCVPPCMATLSLSFPQAGAGGRQGGVPGGPLDPANHFSPRELAIPLYSPRNGPREGSSCLSLAPQAGPAGLGQSEQDLWLPH